MRFEFGEFVFHSGDLEGFELGEVLVVGAFEGGFVALEAGEGVRLVVGAGEAVGRGLGGGEGAGRVGFVLAFIVVSVERFLDEAAGDLLLGLLDSEQAPGEVEQAMDEEVLGDGGGLVLLEQPLGEGLVFLGVLAGEDDVKARGEAVLEGVEAGTGFAFGGFGAAAGFFDFRFLIFDCGQENAVSGQIVGVAGLAAGVEETAEVAEAAELVFYILNRWGCGGGEGRFDL